MIKLLLFIGVLVALLVLVMVALSPAQSLTSAGATPQTPTTTLVYPTPVPTITPLTPMLITPTPAALPPGHGGTSPAAPDARALVALGLIILILLYGAVKLLTTSPTE